MKNLVLSDIISTISDDTTYRIYLHNRKGMNNAYVAERAYTNPLTYNEVFPFSMVKYDLKDVLYIAREMYRLTIDKDKWAILIPQTWGFGVDYFLLANYIQKYGKKWP